MCYLTVLRLIVADVMYVITTIIMINVLISNNYSLFEEAQEASGSTPTASDGGPLSADTLQQPSTSLQSQSAPSTPGVTPEKLGPLSVQMPHVGADPPHTPTRQHTPTQMHTPTYQHMPTHMHPTAGKLDRMKERELKLRKRSSSVDQSKVGAHGQKMYLCMLL